LLNVFSWEETALFQWFMVGWGFLASAKVCSNQLFKEDAESAGSPIVDLVNFLSNQLFRFGRQRDHYFAHGISRLLEIALYRFMLIPCGHFLSAKNKSEKKRILTKLYTRSLADATKHALADKAGEK
jgi:hypothetical protein